MPNHADFDRARAWLSRFETGLRAGDALRLAIASNRGAEAIYSLDKLMIAALDKLMIAAGKTLGVPTRARGLLPSYDD